MLAAQVPMSRCTCGNVPDMHSKEGTASNEDLINPAQALLDENISKSLKPIYESARPSENRSGSIIMLDFDGTLFPMALTQRRWTGSTDCRLRMLDGVVKVLLQLGDSASHSQVFIVTNASLSHIKETTSRFMPETHLLLEDWDWGCVVSARDRYAGKSDFFRWKCDAFVALTISIANSEYMDFPVNLISIGDSEFERSAAFWAKTELPSMIGFVKSFHLAPDPSISSLLHQLHFIVDSLPQWVECNKSMDSKLQLSALNVIEVPIGRQVIHPDQLGFLEMVSQAVIAVSWSLQALLEANKQMVNGKSNGQTCIGQKSNGAANQIVGLRVGLLRLIIALSIEDDASLQPTRATTKRTTCLPKYQPSDAVPRGTSARQKSGISMKGSDAPAMLRSIAVSLRVILSLHQFLPHIPKHFKESAVTLAVDVLRSLCVI